MTGSLSLVTCFLKADDAVIQAVVQILSSEEKQLGLQQPDGIGQRPRPVNIDYHSASNNRQDSNDTDSVSSENSNHSQRLFYNSSRWSKKNDSESGMYIQGSFSSSVLYLSSY